MKPERLILTILFFMTMQTGFSQKSKLLGTWQSSDGSEVIFTEEKVTIDGVKYDYRVQGRFLYVNDQFGNPYQYTYVIEGNHMQLNIPGMGTYSFTKKQTVKNGGPLGSLGKPGGEGQSPHGELMGNWQATNGTVTSFDRQYMTIAGDKYKYKVIGNIITVYDAAGNSMVYKYQVKANQLYLYVEGTGTYVLTRATGGRQDNGSYQEAANTNGSTTANARLYGTFCSYSSSGYSSSSSYSTTRHVSFDGKGHYSYGSESSYSGNGDGYVGSDSGYSGTYRVQGKKVILTENDGTQYVATIFFVQDSGEITELKYGETVFAKALCE